MRLDIPRQMWVCRSLLDRHLDVFSCLPIFEQDETKVCCYGDGLASFLAGQGLGTRLAMARAGCQSHGSCKSVGR